MIDLGSTEFHLAVPSVPEAELKRLSSTLFDSWDEYVDTALSLQDYSLFLQVEEGSVRGIAKIGAVLGVLYMGIGNYGGFISGIKTIVEQVEATSQFVTEHVRTVFSCLDSKATTRKRGGVLASIQYLFLRVQRGELSPEEATVRAQTLLGEEGTTTPEFLEGLAAAFRSCPLHHEQQVFPFVADLNAPRFEVPDSPQRQRVPGSTPVLGPTLQLRIEVWRESKKKRKHTRVLKL